MDIPICYPGFSTIQPVASLNPHRRRVIEAGLGPTAKAGVSFFQGWAVKVRGGGVSGPKKRCMKSFMYPTFYESHSRWVFFLGGGVTHQWVLNLCLGLLLCPTQRCGKGTDVSLCIFEELPTWELSHILSQKGIFESLGFSWLSRERWEMWSFRMEGKHSASVSTMNLI